MWFFGSEHNTPQASAPCRPTEESLLHVCCVQASEALSADSLLQGPAMSEACNFIACPQERTRSPGISRRCLACSVRAYLTHSAQILKPSSSRHNQHCLLLPSLQNMKFFCVIHAALDLRSQERTSAFSDIILVGNWSPRLLCRQCTRLLLLATEHPAVSWPRGLRVSIAKETSNILALSSTVSN